MIRIDPSEAQKILSESAKIERQKAYREEADPLYFKFAAGEITKDEWLAKRNEIKARIPEKVFDIKLVSIKSSK